MTETHQPDPTDRKPALRSLTLRGALSMAIAYGLMKLHLDLPGDLPEGAPQAIADALADLIFYAGLIAVGVGRARARAPLS